MFAGTTSAVQGIIQQGGKVIFDAVITNSKIANQVMVAFNNFTPIYIGVNCGWEKLEALTLSRHDRTVEEAKFGYENSPKHFT